MGGTRAARHGRNASGDILGVPVLGGALELQHDPQLSWGEAFLAGRITFKPFVGHGRAGEGAAQVIEFLALSGAVAHRRSSSR